MGTITTIKSSGATFTPTALANFLSDKILKYTNVKESIILDPACGDGALLVSVAKK
jgi:type I restriction-modification system DNA methylase subunit